MNQTDLVQKHLLDVELEAAMAGDFAKSEAILRQLITVYPDDHRAHFNYGWFLLMKGEFQKGYEELEHGREIKVYGNGFIPTKKPIWNPRFDLLDGKTIILSLEGGYGDEILNARFVSRLHQLGGKVVLVAHPDLHGVFSRIPNVEKLISVREVQETLHDFWMPGFSAAWVSGLTNETLSGAPYLSAELALIAKWRERLAGEKFKIGVRWAGNPKYENQQHRLFPASLMLGLRDVPGVQLYSLQRDENLQELSPEVIDLKDELSSWEETAAAIANLDLVISSCTSVAHLAAAMGKPTWVVTPILAYHCWALPGRTSPWYDSVRLFRQEKFGEWDAPFELLRNELTLHIQNKMLELKQIGGNLIEHRT